MAVHEVRLPRGLSGAAYIVAVQRARRVAEDGDTALVALAGDRAAGAAYLTCTDGRYQLDTASLLTPTWTNQVLALLNTTKEHQP